MGRNPVIESVGTGGVKLHAPRDLAFHPRPGRHLGPYSDGQSFPTDGQELWIADGHDHSLMVLTGIDSASGQPAKALTRRDRGYYHYMHNVTAISFNMVDDSGREDDRDTFGYVATCQDSNNTYLGLKEPNFFMGPSLYDTRPEYKNLVGQDGGPCLKGDDCYMLHADMLHESPSCIGIVHDPEVRTAYGTVYWAFDGWNGELIRYDFQQPHGPSLMQHAAAAVRRYPEVVLKRGPHGVHAGMVIDPSSHTLFIANVGAGTVLAVDTNTGSYARDARKEYPIFSARVPQFEYSIWECIKHRELATGLQLPSGLALSPDGHRLFISERGASRITVIEPASGVLLASYSPLSPTSSAPLLALSGLALSPAGDLFVADERQGVFRVRRGPQDRRRCSGAFSPAATEDFPWALLRGKVEEDVCLPDATIPDQALFEQVHTDSGYADTDEAVQNDSAMHAGAAALADRTDCSAFSDLNFDALLLGGYYCHPCLPDPCAEQGRGTCTNIWWRGYECSQTFFVSVNPTTSDISIGTTSKYISKGYISNNVPVPVAPHTSVAQANIILQPDTTYRFVVDTPGHPIFLSTSADANRAPFAYEDEYMTGVDASRLEDGVLTLQVTASTPSSLFMHSGAAVGIGGVMTVSHPTIVQMALDTPSLSTLVSLLTKPALAPILQLLSESGTFTVFAPTDEAFTNANIDVDDVQLVSRVLRHHVLNTRVLSSDLPLLQTVFVTTLEGGALGVSRTSSGVAVGAGKVSVADLFASNGVVHVVDAVLLPKDLKDAAAGGDWESTWGKCPSYASGKNNYGYCDDADKSGSGIKACEACDECAQQSKCVASPVWASAWGACPSYALGQSNYGFCSDKDNSKGTSACQACAGQCGSQDKCGGEQKWKSKWGSCSSYTVGKSNHPFCNIDDDSVTGVSACDACPGCAGACGWQSKYGTCADYGSQGLVKNKGWCTDKNSAGKPACEACTQCAGQNECGAAAKSG